MSRDEAYRQLSEHLGVNGVDGAHMQGMSAEDCRRVVEWARPQTDRDWERHNPEKTGWFD